MAEMKPASYDVIDTSAYGLQLLDQRIDGRPVRSHNASVLDLNMQMQADLVFSVGLVEHFNVALTRRAILAHFDLVRPDGIVIITFPTPTLLYRVTRWLLQAAGLWKFPDERPLRHQEVCNVIQERGELLYAGTLWPLILTQGIIVARKSASSVSSPSDPRYATAQ